MGILTGHKRSTWGKDLATIILVWSLARLLLIVWHFPPLVQPDSYAYLPFRETLANPHYPVFYGTFLSLFSPLTVIGIQHVMVLLSGVCLYVIGRQSAGRVAGLATALFVVCYVEFVLYGHSFMSEVPFNFFLSLHLLTLWLGIRTSEFRWFFLSGICIGLAANVRAIILYQGVVLAMALLPFFVRAPRGFRAYSRIVGALLAGFFTVYLPMAALTKLNYGAFTLSSGLGKVLIERLVYHRDAPVAGVTLSDPTLIEIRDYLAAAEPDAGWAGVYAYDQIGKHILHLDATDDQALDPYVKRLWREYVRTYPWRYALHSLYNLRLVGKQHHSFRLHYELFPTLTRMDAASLRYEMPARRPSEDRIATLDRLLHRTTVPTRIPVVLSVILFAGLVVARGMNRHLKMLVACVCLTMGYLTLPPFLVSLPILRYRLPFDLLYALLFGIVLSVFIHRWKRRTL